MHDWILGKAGAACVACNVKAERLLAVGMILMAGRSVVAQTTPDTGALYSGIAFSIAGIVIMILLLVLFRRMGKRRNSGLADDSGLNLMAMKQKNLLTPEEMRMVSQAIARRMAEKETSKKSSSPLTTATLLHDPEVLRLQEEALAKRQQEQQDKAELRKAHPDVEAETVTGGETVSQGTALQSGDPGQGAADLDDVELPPEVQQLADAGILTDEEIENVKRRLRARG